MKKRKQKKGGGGEIAIGEFMAWGNYCIEQENCWLCH